MVFGSVLRQGSRELAEWLGTNGVAGPVAARVLERWKDAVDLDFVAQARGGSRVVACTRMRSR
jgi:hypothetical protein